MSRAIVVGSGPAAVACAYALLSRNQLVTMLDVGERVEPDKMERVNALASREPDSWKPGETDFMRRSMQPSAGGIPVKTVYGSDVAYRRPDNSAEIKRNEVHLTPSYARGGFSTVWGASILPNRAADIRDWPISIADLAPAYEAVLQFIPLAAEPSALDAQFPLYANRWQPLRPSAQSARWLKHVNEHQEALRDAGILAGPARLAVKNEPGAWCRYCGLCLYGCPYRLIYNADYTLQRLRKNSRFNYQDGVMVRRVEEKGDLARVRALDLRTRNELRFETDRLYLAAGVLPTTKILIESLDAYGISFSMATSQHFMFPMLRWSGTPNVRRESLHTLAQLFIELEDNDPQHRTVHLQAYSYSDMYETVLKASKGRYFWEAFPKLYEKFLGRLFIVQGYLHSDETGSIEVKLPAPGQRKTEPVLNVTAKRRSDCLPRIRGVLWKLFRKRRALGAWPVTPMLQVSALGQGFHNGGTFPMRENPGPLESDRWGRPAGWKRIHVVDSTIMPSIPATTVTLTAMANAYRIGLFDE